MSIITLADRSYKELHLEYDADRRTFWTWMDFQGRPTFNWTFMTEVQEVQNVLVNDPDGFDFHVLASRVPGIYCFGGDLENFANAIRQRDREEMMAYAVQAIDVMWGNSAFAKRCNAISIGLVQGDALGGGFEAALSCDFVVAERGSKFGLPEIMFNLFPGMGAYSFLTRKIGSTAAERMIMSNQTYDVDTLKELGLIDVVCEPGEGKQTTEALIDHIRMQGPEHFRSLVEHRAQVQPTYDELKDVVIIWAEAALALPDSDVRRMEKLVAAQYRRLQQDGHALTKH